MKNSLLIPLVFAALSCPVFAASPSASDKNAKAAECTTDCCGPEDNKDTKQTEKSVKPSSSDEDKKVVAEKETKADAPPKDADKASS